MQFFKLLALVPLAASLVAASSAQPAHIAALAARNQQEMKPKCDTSSITQVAVELEANVELSVEASVDIYAKYINVVESTVSSITTDIQANFAARGEIDAKVLLQAIVDLKAVVKVSIDVLLKINEHVKTKTCKMTDLDKKTQNNLVAVFAHIQGALDAYVTVWAQIQATVHADVKAQIDASIGIFVKVFSKYYTNCSESFIGLNVWIEATVKIILNLLLEINVNLNLDVDALLRIGS